MIQYVAFATFLAASTWFWYRAHPMFRMVREDLGPRETRLVMRRALAATGLWQWSVALVLIASGNFGTPWALFLCGGLLLFGSRRLWLFGYGSIYDGGHSKEVNDDPQLRRPGLHLPDRDEGV